MKTKATTWMGIESMSNKDEVIGKCRALSVNGTKQISITERADDGAHRFD